MTIMTVIIFHFIAFTGHLTLGSLPLVIIMLHRTCRQLSRGRHLYSKSRTEIISRELLIVIIRNVPPTFFILLLQDITF